MKKSYKMLNKNPKGNKLLGRGKHKWEDNIIKVEGFG